jgi:hypothetical protein
MNATDNGPSRRRDRLTAELAVVAACFVCCTPLVVAGGPLALAGAAAIGATAAAVRLGSGAVRARRVRVRDQAGEDGRVRRQLEVVDAGVVGQAEVPAVHR